MIVRFVALVLLGMGIAALVLVFLTASGFVVPHF